MEGASAPVAAASGQDVILARDLGSEALAKPKPAARPAGYRILATIAKGEVRLWSRNALEWTDKIPDIRDAVAALGLESGALDGELIAATGTKQDFNLLQSTLSGERLGKLFYALFDVLHLNGVDVSGAPLLERKELLQELLEDAPAHLAFSSHIEGDGHPTRNPGRHGQLRSTADPPGPRRRGRTCPYPAEGWGSPLQLLSSAHRFLTYEASRLPPKMEEKSWERVCVNNMPYD